MEIGARRGYDWTKHLSRRSRRHMVIQNMEYLRVMRTFGSKSYVHRSRSMIGFEGVMKIVMGSLCLKNG